MLYRASRACSDAVLGAQTVHACVCSVLPTMSPAVLEPMSVWSADANHLQEAIASACAAAEAGVPTVIANGSRPDVLLRVRFLF